MKNGRDCVVEELVDVKEMDDVSIDKQTVYVATLEIEGEEPLTLPYKSKKVAKQDLEKALENRPDIKLVKVEKVHTKVFTWRKEIDLDYT